MTRSVDPAAALDRVAAAIRAEFSTGHVVVAEDGDELIDRKRLCIPAIIVQISDIEPSPDDEPFTGQFPCRIRFEAWLIEGFRGIEMRRKILNRAARLATFVHCNRFGVYWGAAEILSVAPDDFSPRADKYEIWRVEWMHQADLGDFPDDSGAAPVSIHSALCPMDFEKLL